MTSATAPESVKRYTWPYPVRDEDQRIFVDAADHDRVVAALAARLASVEKALAETLREWERTESWLQIQKVASPSAKTESIWLAAQRQVIALRALAAMAGERADG